MFYGSQDYGKQFAEEQMKISAAPGFGKKRKTASHNDSGAIDGIWVLDRPCPSRLDALLLALLRLSAPHMCPFCSQDHRPPGPGVCEPYRQVMQDVAREWAERHG